jgi:hypothetical protein
MELPQEVFFKRWEFFNFLSKECGRGKIVNEIVTLKIFYSMLSEISHSEKTYKLLWCTLFETDRSKEGFYLS